LFVVDPKDKSCAHPDAKPFNSYLLNRLQNRRESFTVDFSDPIVQRALIEDAVSCCIDTNNLLNYVHPAFHQVFR
jgi:hypothetical protein